MADTLKSDVKGEFDAAANANTMAREIYDALVEVIPLAPAEDPAVRQRLAIAIARGVLRHLEKNAAAFRVKVTALNAETKGSLSVSVPKGWP